MLRLKAAVTPWASSYALTRVEMDLLGPGARSVPRRRASPGANWARRLVRMALASAWGEVADAGADVEGEDGGSGGALDVDGLGDVVGELGANGKGRGWSDSRESRASSRQVGLTSMGW